MNKKILILTDGKAGHENQSKAFARGLGGEIDIVEIHFKSPILKLLSYLLDNIGVQSLALFRGVDGLVDRTDVAAVVGTGSGTFYAVKTLARRLGVKGAVVLYPRGYHVASFDCILAPAFDRPPKTKNIIKIPVNFVANDAAHYEKGVADFRARTDVTPDLAVIIGGPNKRATMTPAWMKRKLDVIFAEPGVKAVTTSRRTPPEVEAVVDSYPWDYKLIYSRENFNPIPAFVSLAKRLYVSADSTGMISEACSFGTACVVVLDNLDRKPHKYRRFVNGLVRGGFVGWDSTAARAGKRKVDLTLTYAVARRMLGL